MHIYSVLYFIDRAVTATRPVAREENPPSENFSPPWKNALDIVLKNWTPLRKLIALLVHQAGYGPAYRCYLE